jgi:hypothetical protein
MWKANVVLVLLAMVASTGCVSVVSLHPLVTPKDADALFEPGLVGTWQDDVELGDKSQYVVTHDDSGYAVTVRPGAENRDGKKEELKLKMQLLKVGGQELLDVDCPSDDPGVPVHIFIRLRLERDSAWVAMMDSEWLKEQIKNGVMLRHEVLTEDNGRILLTGPSSELRSYLLPYVNDDRSFEGEGELRRVN